MDKWLAAVCITVALVGPITIAASDAFRSDEEKRVDAYKECLKVVEDHNGNPHDCEELLKK